MTAEEFQKIVPSIPQQPGVYKYFDIKNELLYVGKAKSLRKRITSYFTKTFTGYKTHELVLRIHRIEFTIVNTEQDAFLLENSLIKEFQPKFNINLKDDKSYPYIVIKKEPFSRIFLTRRKTNDGSEYLGPFTSAGKVRELISFVRNFVPLRNCKLNLTSQNIEKKKFKVCLEYHLGNCKGPCENLQSEEDYMQGIQQVKQILRGNLSPVIQYYKKEMAALVAELRFEKAEQVKKKLEYLENYQSKSIIVSKHLNNIDVFSIVREDTAAFVNYLMVQNGTIVQTHTVEMQIKLDEPIEEVLTFAIVRIRETFNSLANEIIVPFTIEYPAEEIMISVPKGGDKKKLLDLSAKNVNYFIEEIRRKKMLHLEQNNEAAAMQVLQQLQHDLHLPVPPVHIECFDNSNFHGSFPVAAMVYFKDGMPSSKDYRHYNIKTVQGINDFASMKEVVYRRYKRLLDEEKELPQLIIIDGGKGQLSAAMESITALQLENKVTVVGLAKNEEEIFFPGDKESIKLSYNSESLKLIRRIRDEVHRFGITFHRQKRSKGTFVNELEQIKGIGKATADMLLKKYKSVKNIRKQNEEEIAALIGKSRALLLKQHFLK